MSTYTWKVGRSLPLEEDLDKRSVVFYYGQQEMRMR